MFCIPSIPSCSVYELVSPPSHTTASVQADECIAQETASRSEATPAVRLLGDSLHPISLVSPPLVTAARGKTEKATKTKKDKISKQRKRKHHPR